jgi:N-acetylglutamate synthase-like GNAT family acetyltransferase
VARTLHRHIETELRSRGAGVSYLVAIESNDAAFALFEREGFALHATLVMPGLLVHREMEEGRDGIRMATAEDLPRVARLINDTWQGYEFGEPVTAEALGDFIARTPAFGIENVLLIEEDGEVLACLGYWDWSQVTRLTVQGLSTRLRLLSGVLDLASWILPLPGGVHAGDTLAQVVLTPVGYRCPGDLAPLVRRVNNVCLAAGIDQIFAVCDRACDLLEALHGFVRMDSGLHLMWKSLEEGIAPGRGLSYVDGRDL